MTEENAERSATEAGPAEASATELSPAPAPPQEADSSDGPDAQAAAAEPAASGSDPDTHRFECRSCGFVFDPGEGIAKLGIAPGTPFSALDVVSFRCPVCRSKVAAFRDIGPRNKPSGFEENLGYGLGVNQLTPGQKNVLIFGGFALAFAFFLSLYSLR